MIERRRRMGIILLTAILAVSFSAWGAVQDTNTTNREQTLKPAITQNPPLYSGSEAAQALSNLAIKGRAPKTGYERTQFGNGWTDMGNCDIRNMVLGRDLTDVQMRSPEDCTVLSGILQDPYTGQSVGFVRGATTSTKVQIDHVVALSDAWQKGAQQLHIETRQQFANDPLNLLAVDGQANTQKSDGDAATWLPPNKSYRCRYVARQIAVKQKYSLWVTQAEHNAMDKVLETCPGQRLPLVDGPS